MIYYREMRKLNMNEVMLMKVIKFGGSSVASAEQIKKIKDIIVSDADRRIVVVSAPGKRFPEDTKVTDLLIDLASQVLNGNKGVSHVFNQIVNRYKEIATDLAIDEDIVSEISHSLQELIEGDTTEESYFMDALKASGEDNSAKLIAAYLRSEGIPARYISPKEAGLYLSDEPGNAQILPESYQNLFALRDYDEIIIFPGFFGFTKTGKLVTFSRGGSDVTGAILANGVKATLYENFTDVDCIYSASPSIIEKPVPIEDLTYTEMRELSYSGFSVVHDEALYPAFAEGIPVVVKNTNNPTAPGTKITRTRSESEYPLAGVASKSGFASIYISKYMMNREVGFINRVLDVLEDYNISLEHIVSGIDDIDIVFKEEMITAKQFQDLLVEIKVKTAADVVEKRDNLCLVMLVGQNMRHKIGLMARATKALGEAQVNIDMINQGSSENSIMFGINENEEERAVAAIYKEFFESDK